MKEEIYEAELVDQEEDEDLSEDFLDVEVEEKPDRRNNTTKMGILSEGQLVFASEIAKGTGVSESYRLAFPNAKESPYVHKYANKLINNPKIRQQIELLQQAARMRFVIDAPRAAEKMIELSKEAKSEKVQLEATKDILNRGGLQPPQRVETIHVGIFGSASQDDIRNLLRQQLEDKEEEKKDD